MNHQHRPGYKIGQAIGVLKYLIIIGLAVWALLDIARAIFELIF